MGNRQVKSVVIVPTFYHNRVLRFIKSWHDNPPGAECDLIFVHNCIEGPKNREPNYDPRKDEVEQVVRRCGIPEFRDYLPNVNEGEDLGAQHYGYSVTKDRYDVFFFINEIVVFNRQGWLDAHIRAYEDPSIGATSPQICRGIRYPWCLRSTFWSARSDVLKSMSWKKPLTREDAQVQEMELVWPHVRKMGLFCKQVGNGTEWMNYYYDNGSPYTNFTHDHEVVV